MKYSIAILVLSAGIFAGCSTTKNLPANKTLLNKYVYVYEPKKSVPTSIQSEIEDKARPRPNSKLLGMKYKLFLYNLAGPPKGKGLRHLLRNKIGEAPITAEAVNLKAEAETISSILENYGFFRPVVAADTSIKQRKTTITYTIKVGKQYKIRNVIFPTDDKVTSKIIYSAKNRSLLKPDMPFDLNKIKQERERIDDLLKQQGYFYFNPDYIIAQVDSNHTNMADVYLKVKQDIPEEAAKPYKIDRITVYPTYNIKRDSLLLCSKGIFVDSVYVVDPRNRYHPSIFARAIQFRSGDLYTRNLHSRSLTRMVNLDAFQFVNLSFTKSDTSKLNATFYLTPAKRNSLSLGITTSTKSNNYFNTDIKTTIKNRNVFRGAEIFELSASSGMNIQLGGNSNAYNSYTVASNLSISTPRFITPFHRFNWYDAEATKTKAAIGYELLNKQPDYTIHSLTGTWSYIWKKHKRDEHELTLLNINLVRPVNLSSKIDSITATNPSLKQSLDKQLIWGTIYNFTYSNQFLDNRRFQYYFNASQEFSGNIIDLIKGGRSKGYDQNTLFGVPYSQYSRSTIDYRVYYKLNRNNTWASRIFVGVGVPYGNSKALPYIKQFYSGGSNSLRGFRSYTIGPGAFHTSDVKVQTNQTGDIKLEANTELRTNIWKFLKGAVFFDAGNVWLLNSNINKSDASFKFSNFYKQIAVSTGVGFRFDLSFLILRFDIGMPLRVPYLPEGERWVIDNIHFNSKQWRKDNLILNIAIGYPF